MIRERLTVWLVFRFTGRINSSVKLLKCLPLLLSLCCAYAEVVTKENVEKFRASAEQGDASAQCSLGAYYGKGIGVSEDDAEGDEEAVKWFRKAADQGNAGGQYNLGLCYSLGVGVPRDGAEAVKWYRKAADQGNADAQFQLGIFYCTGKNVPKDNIAGYMWFNLAAAQGNELAKKGKELASESMTKEQIAEAQKMSREWQERFDKREKK